ncbi:MAG: 3-dehydroquinate synthase [Lachnospiraceae bacterium]|nr:3-dehydroquinate synthase [Lachnospiraceae bacterium]
MAVNKDKKFCYPIVFEDSFEALEKVWKENELSARKICIVTDSNVEPIYAEEVKKELEKVCDTCLVYAFAAGEENKNLDVVQALYAFLIENHFERKDMLVALGGGVVGDLTGFAAATYLRGISFVQIPTTLLSQVDSSIGGKTGVDFSHYKNMVGAFYMPKLVYMNLNTLSTLPERQFYAGMGEVLKSALIKDGTFYGWIINNLYEIYEKDPEVIRLMVYNCCNIKRLVVEKDWGETGERALLNFGHTIGHAIEKAKGFELLHGECVALGMVAASFIAYKRQLLSFDEYYEIRDMFVPFNLPITVEGIDPQEIVNLTKSDKKMEEGKIKFILLKKIGKAYIDTTVTEEELLAGINEIYVSDEEKYD